MHILIIGSGGREHALAWKIRQSPLVTRLSCAPGNPGIAELAACFPIEADDVDEIRRHAVREKADLVVIGPEGPLAHGLADTLHEAGIRAFGPLQAAAQLETSKLFAKTFMQEAGIPTAAFAAFDDAEAAKDYVREGRIPIVVKADGLAGGKGVTVARDEAAALAAIDAAMTQRVFGEAGNTVVLEECLYGEEASVFALCDGENYVMMQTSQDHKPLLDQDEGPNTGGMGAYSPAPVVTEDMLGRIDREIVAPAVAGMKERGTPYHGVLYAGLMITREGPKAVEFNCRFGDPETQAVLPRMESDLVPLLLASCDGTLSQHSIAWRREACLTVVCASAGYPGAYEKGKPITMNRASCESAGGLLFHAGTAEQEGQLVTNGGRVLGVTALGETIAEAQRNAYDALCHVEFEGMTYRRDIGDKAFRHLPEEEARS